MSRTFHRRSNRREHDARLCFQGHLDCFMVRERMVRTGSGDPRCIVLRTPVEEAARLSRWRRRRDMKGSKP